MTREKFMKLEYPEGLDCIWIAIDQGGKIGAFITAGVGPIPADVLQDTQLISVQNLEERLLELPRISDARMLVSLPRPDDYVSLAERGFYVYDWSDVHSDATDLTNAYELTAIPISPITAEQLPADLLELVENIRLLSSDFSKDKKIFVENDLECVSSE
jgi:hypothetical protein